RTQVQVEPLTAETADRAAFDRSQDRDAIQHNGRRDAGGRPVVDRSRAREELRNRLDPFEPAYRHGSVLAEDARYRNAEWQDVEPHARRTWEEQHEGSWEQFKDAVRHAWEKVSGR